MRSVLVSCLAACTAVGCGDDDDDDVSPASGGKASGGGGGKGGSTSGGVGGQVGSGGTKASEGGGTGDAGGPSGGKVGSGGSANGGAVVAQGGAAGEGTAPLGGAGGETVEPIGGSGGSETDLGGAGGVPSNVYAPISKVSGAVWAAVNELRGLTFAANGKIYGSGHIGADAATADRKLAIVRLTAAGAADTTFGGGDGIVDLNLNPRVVDESVTPAIVVNTGDEQSVGIVELANGNIVVQVNVRTGRQTAPGAAAIAGQQVWLLQFDSTGAPVTTFGTNGAQRIDLGWDGSTAVPHADWTAVSAAADPTNESWGIALDKSSGSEKIVVFAHGPAAQGQKSGTGASAVQRTDNDRYITRVLAATGAIDPAFNAGKVFFYNTGGTFSDGGRRGNVETDGTILSTGYTNFGDGLGNHVVAIRLKPNGTLDNTFGFGIVTKGVVRSNPFLDDGGIAECYAAAKQSNGRYVTIGYGRATAANVLSSYDYATTDAVDSISIAFTATALDTSFGRRGTLVLQSEEAALGNTEDRGRDIVALPDDRLVIVGKYGPFPSITVTLPDGALDESFGVDGRLTYPSLGAPLATPPIATSHFYRIALSPDGKRVVAATNNHADGVLVTVLEVDE